MAAASASCPRLLLLTATVLASLLAAAPASANDFGWSGYRVGLHAGGGWGGASGSGGTAGATADESLDLDGGLIGLQLGYDQQLGHFVIGVEGDYSFAHLRGTGIATVGGVDFGLDNELEYLASLRARFGMPVDDSLLLFATVGGGWSRYRLEVSTPLGQVSAGADVSGVVYGGGLDWLLERGMLVRGEVLHYDFGKAEIAADSVGGSAEVDADATVLRSALSFTLN